MSVLAAGAATASRLALLADPTDVGDETHKGGPFAILVIAVLCIVCFFLFRSMSKHLRRVREDFPEGVEGAGPDGGSAARTAATDDAGAGTTPPSAPGSVRPVPKSRSAADHPAGR